MANSTPYKVKSISEFHRLHGLPKPQHPLISVITLESLFNVPIDVPKNQVISFYSISIKRALYSKFKYGQQDYDFDEGLMYFMAPNQVYGIELDDKKSYKNSGWILLVHPDFLWNTALAKIIRQYEYFNYSVNEALFLSDKEEQIIIHIFKNIQQEYHSNIDKYSQGIIISQIETLLNYAERFYQRQFVTRQISNHKLLDRFENLITKHFNNENVVLKGLPSVQDIAKELNVSAGYLGSLIKLQTGESTQQQIHNKLIEKAKEKLSTTELSIGEIAYGLGFEHPQSFSKLFKSKTNLSPSAFRRSFY